MDELSNPEATDSKSHFNHTDHNPNITVDRLRTQWGIWAHWHPQKHSMLRDVKVLIFSVSWDEFREFNKHVRLEYFIELITV